MTRYSKAFPLPLVLGMAVGTAGSAAAQDPHAERALALMTMHLTQKLTKHNFLSKNGVATPMPVVEGALPAHARVLFPSLVLSLPVDLLVIFTIGDFDPPRQCSSYYVPDRPWYNVFYGAYGVRSREADGSWWGYDAAGNVQVKEMLEVPELDYNVLTAGQLGCPPEKQIFQVLETKTSTVGAWDRGEVVAMVPSGLHRLKDAILGGANPTYYSIFGFPDSDLIGSRPSYEPVKMRGEMFFRRVTEATGNDRITLVWGAMCPDTSDGNALLQKIIGAMKPLYQSP